MCNAVSFSKVISSTPLGVVAQVAASLPVAAVESCSRVAGTSWVTTDRHTKAFGSAGLVIWDYWVKFDDEMELLVSAIDTEHAAGTAMHTRARLQALSIAA